METELATVIILVKNESDIIEKCIRSAFSMTNRIIIVDSYSNDGTCETVIKLNEEYIKQQKEINLVQHKFENHGRQFNWALETQNITTPYVIRIDADEIFPEMLAEEILEACKNHLDDDTSAFVITFKTYFLGRFLKHGGAYPFRKMVVFKYGKALYDERSMHDHLILKSGSYIYLKNDGEHYAVRDIEKWVLKHIRYANMEVSDCLAPWKSENNEKLELGAKVRKKLRDNLYYHLPMFTRAWFVYIYSYYFQLGFLDGQAGKVYAFFRSYWYRFLIDAKLLENQVAKHEPLTLEHSKNNEN